MIMRILFKVFGMAKGGVMEWELTDWKRKKEKVTTPRKRKLKTKTDKKEVKGRHDFCLGSSVPCCVCETKFVHLLIQWYHNTTSSIALLPASFLNIMAIFKLFLLFFFFLSFFSLATLSYEPRNHEGNYKQMLHF